MFYSNMAMANKNEHVSVVSVHNRKVISGQSQSKRRWLQEVLTNIGQELVGGWGDLLATRYKRLEVLEKQNYKSELKFDLLYLAFSEINDLNVQ